MLSIFLLFFFLFLIIIIGVCIVYIVALWRIFEKAGEPGWAALIPIYNGYILLKIVGMNPIWIFVPLGLNIIVQTLNAFGSVFGAAYLIALPITLLNSAVSIYITIATSINLARSFNKENNFALGLIFLSPVFYGILGFGQDQYVGPNPIKDFLFKNENEKEIRYCLGCGRKVTDETMKFCPHCGKEIKN